MLSQVAQLQISLRSSHIEFANTCQLSAHVLMEECKLCVLRQAECKCIHSSSPNSIPTYTGIVLAL